jgi:hypothetical protein
MAQAAKSNNRRVTIILIVGGVCVALLAAFNLMSGGGGGGGGSSDQSSAIPPITTAESPGSAAAGTTATTAPPAPDLPNGEFDVFATRNPFEPAVQVTSDTTDAGTVPNAGTTDAGTSGSSTQAGTPTDTTPPATGSPQPSAGTTVALIDVFDQGGVTMARVQVGSTVYTVAAGQTFATSYKVVSISGTCGQFLYGDSPFSLCEGEQVIK